MAFDQRTRAVPYKRFATLVICVLILAVTLSWVFLGMRAVMDVGGACAEGGPYVIAQPCPGAAAVLLSLGIPLMIIATFVGTAVAVSLQAPNLLLPMWTVLFGSLGWNFLEYGAFHGGIVWGWLVCGVVFELMALPAAYLMLPGGRGWTPPTGSAPEGSALRWWVAYAGLGVVGFVLAVWSYSAWS